MKVTLETDNIASNSIIHNRSSERHMTPANIRPESAMTVKPDKYKKLKIAVDIASVVFIVYFLIVCPIICHYDPNCIDSGNPHAKLPIEEILEFVDGIPFIFGIIWLNIRYISVLKKYRLIPNPRI